MENKGQQDAQPGVGRSQGPTTESGTESTLEFDSFNSDLTCSRSQGTLVARILLEPRSPPSAQLSAHHFPQPPNPQSQLGTKEDSITKLSLFPLFILYVFTMEIFQHLQVER